MKATIVEEDSPEDPPTLLSAVAKIFDAGATIAGAVSAKEVAAAARQGAARARIADAGVREVAKSGAVVIERTAAIVAKGRVAAESAKPILKKIAREMRRVEDRSVVVDAREGRDGRNDGKARRKIREPEKPRDESEREK